MDIAFFAFSNNQQEPLATLQREADELHRYISERAFRQHFMMLWDPTATREKLSYYLSRHRERIVLFHYSGHAGRDRLVTQGEVAQAEGMAKLLGQCPNLKLVVLNGCSTRAQVQALLDEGVPAVVATSAPVKDNKATDFSIAFYQALANNEEPLRQAFDLAEADLKTQTSAQGITIHRGFDLPANNDDQPLWGLFTRDDQPQVLQWKLPVPTQMMTSADYTPNEQIVESLMRGLKPYSRRVRSLVRDEEEGEEVDLSDKRMAILNSLPAPIAEQLRRLMVPLAEQHKGYNRIGQPRLEQLVETATTTIELLIFTLLAQLWEAMERQMDIQIGEGVSSQLRLFLKTPPDGTVHYDSISLLEGIYQLLAPHLSDFHFEELGELRAKLAGDSDFQDACYYLLALRRRLRAGPAPDAEVGYACERAEQSLSLLLESLGFLARYTLAAVRNISVLKFKHLQPATYRHSVVRLIKVLGGMDQQLEEREECLDSLSVLLLNEGQDKPAYLNLTPFVIDKNAFEGLTETSQIFFFSHLELNPLRIHYHNVYQRDAPLVVGQGAPFELLTRTFEAFAQRLFQQSLTSL